ncbi:MAG: ATP-dependent Clp protease adaptor ClpS [Hungatella sp.]|jgi:ATP-dependent Clp protease adaptor protein ClpS|nr:ATP-dependent Clp protease adaptor ClpS [Hungatella sp.]
MAIKEQVKEQAKSKVKVPKQYQVLIYNDDFTPMDFVVEVLMVVFDKEETAAVTLMMSIHKGSYAVAGVYPKDIARTKAAEAVQWARSEGYPLKVEAVCQP